MTLGTGFWRALRARPLAEPMARPDTATVRALTERLDETARRRLGRSLVLRHLDAGSCNACELELVATQNVLYDLERFGLRFAASPRHADVLLVTGPMTRNMREAASRTYQAMGEPKWVIAIGDCAIDGGVFKGSPAVEDGAEAALPVDLVVRGCPPTPEQVITALRALLAANDAG